MDENGLFIEDDTDDKIILVKDIEEYHKVSMNQITHALKLQRLVKEKINQERPKFDGLVSSETYKDLQRQYHSTALTLQSLVKESEN